MPVSPTRTARSTPGHLKKAIEDALLLRGSRDFADLAAWRCCVDEVVGRRNARNAKRIDQERSALRPLPARRTTDYDEVLVRVTSSSGFTLRKVFYSVPSPDRPSAARAPLRRPARLLPRLRAHDPAARPGPQSGKHGHVVDYRHVIRAYAQEADGAAPPRLSRSALPPARLCARFGSLAKQSAKHACRTMVGLLALAHERACEAELAQLLTRDLDAGRLPDLTALRARFAPSLAELPAVAIDLAPLAAYDEIAALATGETA